MTPFYRRNAPALWIVLFFVAAGLAFIGKAGLHFDAAYELACFYNCSSIAYKPTLLGHTIPVMVIQYLGSLKAWLYWPLLTYLNVTPMVLRVPLLLTAAGSVWLSFGLLDRISGRPAAIAGSLLLATDSVFLIASTYDFGPIVLLHFFLLAGVLLLLTFERTCSLGYLALAFFLFGWALWHKALAIWMITGLSMAAVIVAPKRIRELCSVRRLLVAALALVMGALPLICYNIATGGETLRTQDVMSGAAPLSQKILVLRKTLEGSVLFGWLTEEHQHATVAPSMRFDARASRALSGLTGGVRSHLLLAAFVLSLLAIPFLWFTPSRRAVLFVVIYLATVWLQMLVLPNTGATMHHVLLLWPFPHFLIAVTLAQCSLSSGKTRGKVIFASVLLVLLASNGLLVNQYYGDLVTNGTTAVWTDATVPLFNYLESLTAKRIVVTDWGYSATLCLLSDGTMPLRDISYVLISPASVQDSSLKSLVSEADTVFVSHLPADEIFAGTYDRLASIATGKGYTSESLATIQDRMGRARFRVFRFVTISP